MATARERVIEDALVVAVCAALAGCLAAGSLAWAAIPVPTNLLLVAPLKLGALGALGLQWSGGRSSAALLTLWTAVWGLPQVIGSPMASVFGLPLEPGLAPQVLASAGLLLLGLALGRTPKSPLTSPG